MHNHSVRGYDANVEYDFYNRDNGDAFPRTNEQNSRWNDASNDQDSDSFPMMPNIIK